MRRRVNTEELLLVFPLPCAYFMIELPDGVEKAKHATEFIVMIIAERRFTVKMLVAVPQFSDK